jgi:glycosyltransferase involved in cell wall biosynthesis
MKILHLISSAGMYGAETVVANLTAAQKALGSEPVIGVFRNHHRPNLALVEQARKRGLRVEVFDCHGRFDRASVRAIRSFVTAQGIEVVHSHGYKSDFYAYLAAKPTGAAFVATCHLWTRSTRSVRFYEFIDSLVLRRARRVIGVSDAITAALHESGISESRLGTIPNGTDIIRFQCSPKTLRKELGIGNRLMIGTVARLERQKGIEYLVRAAQGVVSEFPDSLFVVIGQGSLGPELCQLIRELGLESHVRLLGERNDMPGVYSSLDLFVLPSIDEGMPMTILEALAASCPVIATRVGAVEKLIIEGETGLLVEPRDVPALGAAILSCVRDPALAGRLGSNGQRHVQASFSAEAMARNYLEVYSQALHKQGRAALPACQGS